MKVRKCSICGEEKNYDTEEFPVKRTKQGILVATGARCRNCRNKCSSERNSLLALRQSAGLESMIRTCSHCNVTMKATRYKWVTKGGAVVGNICRQCENYKNKYRMRGVRATIRRGY